MEELLAFLRQNEFGIYLLLGAIAFIYLLKMVSALREWQATVFGLERESAQRRFTTALSILVLLILFVFAEFVIVSFVAPTYPQTSALPTATLDLLATPTVTLPALVSVVSAPETLPTPTAPLMVIEEGCTAGQVEWLNPVSGQQVSQTVELTGTVNVPNLGFYKYEFSQPGSDVWSTIAADNQPKLNGAIGFWNTSKLVPGDYLLRLVVVNNQNQAFPACVIPVRVVLP
jgi:hypothetical protein